MYPAIKTIKQIKIVRMFDWHSYEQQKYLVLFKSLAVNCFFYCFYSNLLFYWFIIPNIWFNKDHMLEKASHQHRQVLSPLKTKAFSVRDIYTLKD